MATRVYEVFGLGANLLGNGNEVRFVRLEETEQGGEKSGLRGPTPELLSPDSGQIEKALRPALIDERCR